MQAAPVTRIGRFSWRDGVTARIRGDRLTLSIQEMVLCGVLLGALAGLATAVLPPQAALAALLAIPIMALFSRYPFGSVLIWVTLLPYVTRTSGEWGANAFLALHLGTIPLALTIVLAQRWFGTGLRRTTRLGLAELCTVGFLIAAALNLALLGENGRRWTIHFFEFLFVPLCMFWLVRLTVPGPRDMRIFAWAGFATVLIQCSIGFLSLYAPQTLPVAWQNLAGQRGGGSFGNPAVYSAALVFLTLNFLHASTESKHRWMRRLAVGLFVMASLSIFLTYSRGSWLGFSLVLVGLIFVLPPGYGVRINHRRGGYRRHSLHGKLPIRNAMGPARAPTIRGRRVVASLATPLLLKCLPIHRYSDGDSEITICTMKCTKPQSETSHRSALQPRTIRT